MIHAPKFVIKTREGEPITLKGLGDIHHLLKDSDEDRFINDLKERTTDQTFFIDLGDNLDSIGPAHKYFSLGRIKTRFLDGSQGEVDPILNAEVKDLVSIISAHTKPAEWIGHVSGNHPLMVLGTGIDLCQILCYELKHRYLGYQAYVPLELVTRGDRKLSLMLFVCHGFGGGGARWEGSGLNSYIQHSSRYDEWDIALYGHRHDKWLKPLARIRPSVDRNGKRWIKEDLKLIGQTGTYLRTLSDSMYPSYSEKKGMSPRPLGCISIQFKVVREDGLLTVKYLNI